MIHIPPQAYRIARELADMGNLRIPLSANDLAYAAQLLCTQFDQIEKLKATQERKPLTDEKITQIKDAFVGEPNAKYPLDQSDWLNFARAIERVHGITNTKGE